MKKKPHQRQPRPAAITAVAPRTAPDPQWLEHDRQASLARWNAERDLVAIEWQEAGGGSARQQDAEALLQHIDAVRADLEAGMIPAAQLSTLERRLAMFRHPSPPPPPAWLGKRGRPFDEISKIVLRLLAQKPHSFQEIRLHLHNLITLRSGKIRWFSRSRRLSSFGGKNARKDRTC